MGERHSTITDKHDREALRPVTVRLEYETASLLDGIASDLRWSTSQLISQLVERSKPMLAQYKKANDIGGLISHLLKDMDSANNSD